MGLDITAYSHLVSIGKHVDDWCGDEDHIEAYAYSCFPASVRGLPDFGSRASYSGASDFLDFGCFMTTKETAIHRFRAGSYSSYNRWRSNLQEQFNPDRSPEEPFYELIWFADNEGAIGPDAAWDLLADFDDNAERYEPPPYGRELYDAWTLACHLAALGGLIHFH